MRLLFLIAVFAVLLPATLSWAADGETLIVFVQQEGSEVDRAFLADRLPMIKQAAKDAEVAFRVVEAAKGAPREISITPLLVFQIWLALRAH